MRREGWHRALDIQMETHKWCLQDTPALYNVGFMSSVIGHVAEDELSSPLVTGTSIVLSKLFTETMWQADTLYVTSDMMHILMQAAHDLPADASFDDHVLITPTGFCMFEEPIVGTDRRDKRILIHAIAWQKQLLQTTDSGEKKMGLVIFFLVDPLDPLDDYNHMFRETGVAMGMPMPPLTLQHFFPARFGDTIREYAPDETVSGSLIIQEALKIFLSMQLIAQQKIGEPMQMRPDRATRRRYAREYGSDERLITLITLRRKSVKKDDEEPAKVEWNRRWVVQGHWRKQWYPKSQTHDYIYIHDYIKGPEDKPLVLSERRVFNFAR